MRLRGRPVAPGRAEGSAVVSQEPFSFVGGADLATGAILDTASGAVGETLLGRVFAFPHGRGSTVGSYVLYGLVKKGLGPAAVVNERTEAIVAAGCILARIPLVDGIDLAILETGDPVAVDGGRGEVRIDGVVVRPVVTAFLENRGRVLVLRRGPSAPTFPGTWSAVSGTLEGSERPVDRARREVHEETRQERIRLRKRGAIVRARSGRVVFEVHPFLFAAPTRKVVLDSENEEARWVRPEDLNRLETVPRLKEALAAVRPG